MDLTVDCVAVGSALAAHLSYFWQAELVNLTDCRERYRAIVIERFGGDLLGYNY